jgi:hypothetical protein
MPIPDNFVSLAGFLTREPVPVAIGFELHMVVHDFRQRYEDSLLTDGYGVGVRVRLPFCPAEQLAVLRRGDRVQIKGHLIAGGMPDHRGVVDPRPMVAAFSVLRCETLKDISRANHPLNPRWCAAGPQLVKG